MNEEDASTLTFGPDFKNSHCLFHAEVSLLLSRITEDRSASQTTPLNNVLTSSMKYVSTFSRFHHAEMTNHLRGLLSAPLGPNNIRLAEYEMAQLVNLCPESSDEAKSLIPSLTGKVEDEVLQSLLDQLSSARKFQS